MNKMIIGKLGFISARQSELLTTAQAIGSKLAVNATLFPSLSPKPADGLLIIDAFETALQQADRAGVAKTAVKDQKKIALQDLMRKWAAQVSIDSNGNMETFLLSGFIPRVANNRPVMVFTPNSPTVKTGISDGSVVLRVEKMRGAHSYTYRYTDKNPATATDADWTVLPSTPTRCTATGLSLYTTYHFQVRVNGAVNSSDWSEYTTFTVQKPMAA